MLTGDGVASESRGNLLVDQALRIPAADNSNDHLLDAVRTACPLAPLVAGNQLTILNDGPSTFEAFAETVGKAKHHVHLETFLFADDALGQSFAALLVAKRQQGVEVRVLYDGIGSLAAAPEFFQSLRQAGVEVVSFRPASGLSDAVTGQVNHRDHRKLLVVDGSVAFVGGINISGTYNQDSSSWSGQEAALTGGWRDVQIRMEGPVVLQYQALFLSAWVRSGGAVDASSTAYYPKLSIRGRSLVAALASEYGEQSEAAIHAAYLAAIHNAKQRVWITQAYFAPDKSLLGALIAAARRGVDIRILLPGFSDSSTVLYASRSVYDRLLESGVKIFEFEAGFVHAKTVTVDGALSFVGSANMDFRSLLHNNEIAAVIVDAVVAAQMEATYRSDLANSREIQLAEWRKRSLRQRAMERAATLMWFWI